MFVRMISVVGLFCVVIGLAMPCEAATRRYNGRSYPLVYFGDPSSISLHYDWNPRPYHYGVPTYQRPGLDRYYGRPPLPGSYRSYNRSYRTHPRSFPYYY